MTSSTEVVISVIGRRGRRWQLQSPAGISLMDSLQDSGEIEAVCGGAASCGTCHVFFGGADYVRLPAPDGIEVAMLEGSEHYRPGCSRLSCQVRLDTSMSGIELTIAPPG